MDWKAIKMNLVDDLLQKYKKLHFSLIDPDKQLPEEAGRRAKLCMEYGTNAIMVGGSTVRNRKMVYDTIEAIKKKVELPTILFPNSANAVSKNADYIFFMTLLNSKEYKYLRGEQLKGAPLIKKWNIEAISMGYLLVNTSKKPTTIEKYTKLDEIRRDDIEKAVNYAIYAEMLGMNCIYLEAGSNAERPISNEMIRAIRDKIGIPIIVGGGIMEGQTAKEKVDAGADVIVNGTAIEVNIENIKDIIKNIRS